MVMDVRHDEYLYTQRPSPPPPAHYTWYFVEKVVVYYFILIFVFCFLSVFPVEMSEFYFRFLLYFALLSCADN